MTKNIINYINEYFSFLKDEFGFAKINEEYDDQYFEVIFQSQNIRIKIEKYHRELYMHSASTMDSEHWADFFNIINYLKQNENINPDYNFYPEIKNLDKCYKMQIKWLSQVLKEYYPLIKDFYNNNHYIENSKQLTEFMIKRYPNLFSRGK